MVECVVVGVWVVGDVVGVDGVVVEMEVHWIGTLEVQRQMCHIAALVDVCETHLRALVA